MRDAISMDGMEWDDEWNACKCLSVSISWCSRLVKSIYHSFSVYSQSRAPSFGLLGVRIIIARQIGSEFIVCNVFVLNS